MNQKDAKAKGFVFGSSNAQKVLKRIRDHVVWSDDLTDEERHEFDQALCILDVLGSKYLARWEDHCRRLNEENNRRNAERLARRVQWMNDHGHMNV